MSSGYLRSRSWLARLLALVLAVQLLLPTGAAAAGEQLPPADVGDVPALVGEEPTDESTEPVADPEQPAEPDPDVGDGTEPEPETPGEDGATPDPEQPTEPDPGVGDGTEPEPETPGEDGATPDPEQPGEPDPGVGDGTEPEPETPGEEDGSAQDPEQPAEPDPGVGDGTEPEPETPGEDGATQDPEQPGEPDPGVGDGVPTEGGFAPAGAVVPQSVGICAPDTFYADFPGFTFFIDACGANIDTEPTVRLHDGQGFDVALDVVSWTEYSIQVSIPVKVPPGSYTLVVQVGGLVYNHDMQALEKPWFEGMSSNQPAFYEGQTVTLHGGEVWTFTVDDLPVVQLLDVNNNEQLVRELSPRYISADTVEVDVEPGLPSGQYRLRASMDDSFSTSQYIYVGLELDAELQSGIADQTITAKAAGVTFAEVPSVVMEWVGQSGLPAPTIQNVEVVAPDQIRFTIVEPLPQGILRIIVQRPDGYIIRHLVSVLGQPINIRRVTLFDQHGDPVQNASVYISVPEEYPWRSNVYSTNDQGQFMVNLPPGDYIVNRWEQGDSLQRTYIPFTITDQFDYQLYEPAHTVVVHIQDADGFGVPGATVTVYGIGEDNVLRHSGIGLRTDAAGFTSLYLPSGEYKLGSVEAGGYQQQVGQQFSVGTDGATTLVEVVVLPPNVSGTVLGHDGAPVANAQIRFHGPSGNQWTWTDDQGAFAARLEPGEYVLDWVSEADESAVYTYYLGDRYTLVVGGEGGPIDLTVQLIPINVQGEARVADKVVDEGYVVILPEGSDEAFDVTIRHRLWHLYAPDGEYFVWFFEAGNREYESDTSFTVTNGTSIPTFVTVTTPPVKIDAGIPLNGVEVALPGYEVDLGPSPQLILFYGTEQLEEGRATIVGATEDEVLISLTGTFAPGVYDLVIDTGERLYEWDLVAEQGANLRAQLLDREGNPVRNRWVDLTTWDEYPAWAGIEGFHTDDEGQFTASLPPGRYVIRRWLFPDSAHETYIYFEITDEFDYTKNPQVLQESEPNVFIRIQDGEGRAVPGAVAILRPHDGQRPIQWGAIEPQAGADGIASMYLPPGYYWLEAIMVDGSSQPVGMRLMIDEHGQLHDESGETEQVVVTALEPNLTGTVVTETGEPVANFHLSFYGVDQHGQDDGQVAWTDSEGRFQVRLMPDMVYHVDQASLFDNGRLLRYRFGDQYRIVVDPEGVADPAYLKIVLPEMNVHGEALVDGKLVPHGSVIMSRTDQPGRNINADIWDGHWTIYVPDGEYHIHELHLGERIYPVDLYFTVTDGTANPPFITVEPMLTNVSGAALDEKGSPIHYGWLMFRSKSDPNMYVTVPVSKGQYTAYLDPEHEWYAVYIGDGPRHVQLDPPREIEVPGVNDIQIPQPSLSAEVLDDAGAPLPFVQVLIRGEGREYWATADASGMIAAYLPQGKYLVVAGWQYGRPLIFGQEISIGADPVETQLYVKSPNVSGTVLTEDGSPAGHASLYLENEAGEAFTLRADSQGRFGARLPDGEYTIRQVTGRSFWFRTSRSFTITAGEPVSLVVQPPAANVFGTVRAHDGQPLAGVQVGFRSSHLPGADTIWARTDAQGSFRVALEPGRHRIVALGSAAGWVEMRQEIVVPEGASLVADVVWPQTTVTGTLQRSDGKPMRNGSVLFTSAVPGVEPVNSRADDSGRVAAALPAGEWIIAGLYDPEAGVFHSLENREQRVVVKPDQSAPVNAGTLAPLTPNVSGRAYADAAGKQPLRNAWVMITSDEPTGQNARTYWAETDGDGRFSLYLNPGRYVVRAVAGQEGYALTLRFAVPAGSLTVKPPQAYVEGTVHVAGAATAAQVAIRPVDGEGNIADDPASTLWVPTNQDGAWRAVLPDGDYAVVFVDTAEARYAVEVLFQVVNGRAVVPLDVEMP